MFQRSQRISFALFVLIISFSFALVAATPPAEVNYQGVLRDAAGNALDGTYDMAFRFYDGADSGADTLLLTDTHVAAGSGAVTVTGGLFSVGLGSGTITAGSETGLADVFRNNAVVYLEVQIGAETLAPLVEIRSTGFAINSDALDGMDASDFSTAAHAHDANYLAKDAADTSSADTSGNMYFFENSHNSNNTVVSLDQSNTDAANGIHRGLYALSRAGDSDGTGGILNSYGVSGVAMGGSRVAGGVTLAHGVSGVANGTPVAGSTQTNYGVEGIAGGGANATNYGVRGNTTATTTGTNFGVSGSASSGSFNYGLRGTASGDVGNKYGLNASASGDGANYGVWGQATGGTTNWGLYTPNDAFVGGKLDFGSGSDDDLAAADVTDLTDGGETALHIHDDRYFGESEFINSSAGAGDAGKPVVLDGSGFIDSTMLDLSGDFLAKDAADSSSAAVAGDMYLFTNTSSTDLNTLHLVQSNNSADNGTHRALYAEARAGDQDGTGFFLHSVAVEGSNSGASKVAGGVTYASGVKGVSYGTPVASAVQNNSGVWGVAFGGLNTTNYGTQGNATGTTTRQNYGAYGSSSSGASNYGSYGEATGNTGTKYGAYGKATGTGNNYGVFGEASGGTNNWGLYTDDNAFIGGLLDFGNGGDDDLTAADVTDLTDGNDSSSHHHDGSYYTESEHLSTSAGAGDAGKPVILNGSGLIDSTMLGSALDADTLDSLDSLQFLRSDADDTAAGQITFSKDPGATGLANASIYINPATADSGDILLGAAVNGSQRLTLDDTGNLDVSGNLTAGNAATLGAGEFSEVGNTTSTTSASIGMSVDHENLLAAGTGRVTGLSVRGSASGAANDSAVYGLEAEATGSVDATGRRYGVYGHALDVNGDQNIGVQGASSNGTSNTGVFGTATGTVGFKSGVYGLATGTGTNIGLYGETFGGTTNWGMFTPNDAHVGGMLEVTGSISSADLTTDIIYDSDDSQYFLDLSNNPTSGVFAGGLWLGFQDAGQVNLYMGLNAGEGAIRYNASDPAFSLSHNLRIEPESISLNYFGPDENSYLYFFEAGSPTGASLAFVDATDRFQLNHGLEIASGALNVTSGGQNTAYNLFGSGTASNADITDFNDVFINDSLQVGDQIVSFDVIHVADVTSTASYSTFGPTSPISGGITGAYDVMISQDLEVNSNLFVTAVIAQAQGGGAGSNDLQIRSDASVMFMMDDDNNSGGNADEFEWYHNSSVAAASKLASLGSAGNLRLKGSVNANYSFDLAETFIKGDHIEAGDLVRVDPDNPQRLLRTGNGNPAGLLGVVSTAPGFLLGGAPFSVQSLEEVWGPELRQEFESKRPAFTERFLAEQPVIQSQLTRLTRQVSGSSPGATGQSFPGELNTELTDLKNHIEENSLRLWFAEKFAPVALAGRVPVKVEGSNGGIRAGDMLSAGATPGRAAKAVSAGPVIGTALEDWDGESDTIMLFVHRGWFAPADSVQDLNSLRDELFAELDNRTADPVTGLQVVDGNLGVVLDRSGTQDSRFSIFKDGGNGVNEEVFRVDENGDLFLKGKLRPSALDLAEYHPVSSPVSIGDVLVVDRQRPGFMRRSSEASDPAVVGVVSSEPGILMGSGLQRIHQAAPELAAQLSRARKLGDSNLETKLWQQIEARFNTTHAPLALSGTVPCKVDATYGAIQPGDLLVASPTPGHAMVSDDPSQGTVVGKALGNLDRGTGTIQVLIMLR